jgi:hypothetical protein
MTGITEHYQRSGLRERMKQAVLRGELACVPRISGKTTVLLEILKENPTKFYLASAGHDRWRYLADVLGPDHDHLLTCIIVSRDDLKAKTAIYGKRLVIADEFHQIRWLDRDEIFGGLATYNSDRKITYILE